MHSVWRYGDCQWTTHLYAISYSNLSLYCWGWAESASEYVLEEALYKFSEWVNEWVSCPSLSPQNKGYCLWIWNPLCGKTSDVYETLKSDPHLFFVCWFLLLVIVMLQVSDDLYMCCIGSIDLYSTLFGKHQSEMLYLLKAAGLMCCSLSSSISLLLFWRSWGFADWKNFFFTSIVSGAFHEQLSRGYINGMNGWRRNVVVSTLLPRVVLWPIVWLNVGWSCLCCHLLVVILSVVGLPCLSPGGYFLHRADRGHCLISICVISDFLCSDWRRILCVLRSSRHTYALT